MSQGLLHHFVLWTKAASALEGLNSIWIYEIILCEQFPEKNHSPFQEVNILSSKCGEGLCFLASKRFCLPTARRALTSSSDNPKNSAVSATLPVIVSTFLRKSSLWGSWKVRFILYRKFSVIFSNYNFYGYRVAHVFWKYLDIASARFTTRYKFCEMATNFP